MAMDEDDELKDEMINEVKTSLDDLDNFLVNLEKNPKDIECVNEIFRLIHSIKGLSSFFDYTGIEEVAHNAEHLLDLLRAGDIEVSCEIITILLSTIDTLRVFIGNIELTDTEGDVAFEKLVKQLVDFSKKQKKTTIEQPPLPETSTAQQVTNDDDDNELKEEMINEVKTSLDELDVFLVNLEKKPEDIECINEIFRLIHSIKGLSSFFDYTAIEEVAHNAEHLLDKLRAKEVKISTEIITTLLTTIDVLRQFIVNIEQSGTEGKVTNEVKQLITKLVNFSSKKMVSSTEQSIGLDKKLEQEQEQEQEQEIIKSKQTDNYIQIDINLLDNLVNLIGELVLSRNQILTYATDSADHDFQHICQNLSAATTKIQENIMKMRLQPVGLVWNKFNRIVRDLAITSNKKINLEMEGRETTLDKSLIDSIKDPLTHLIRNAVDHGIELPAERKAKGKNEAGTLKLKSYQESGQIIIEISDDGRGLQIEKIKNKAIDKGLVTLSELKSMSYENILNLIFTPGFSTNESVTNISGRGVGMDVVKSNIKSIGGTVDISTTVNEGTTFKIEIPLTLAIIPTLIFQNETFHFAIPQNEIIELVRIKTSEIEFIYNVMIYRLRGTLLPIISLTSLLNNEQQNEALDKDKIDTVLSIIVVESNNCRFGLIVDKIKTSQDIVVKPLSNKIKKLLIYSGVTILGNGDIALILNLNELSQKAKLSSDKTLELSKLTTKEHLDAESNLSLVLLIENNNKNQIAVPIEIVKRLEKIKVNHIENVAGKNVVQYQNKILTLIKLSELIDNDGNDLSAYSNNLNIIIYSHSQSQEIGIIIDKVIDSSNEDISKPQGAVRAGVSGTAIIKNKITEILDVDSLYEKIISYVS